jgi:hypothetical protein
MGAADIIETLRSIPEINWMEPGSARDREPYSFNGKVV